MKEFHYIRCKEVGIEYKRLVRSYGEFYWGNVKVFIHKAQPAKWPYVISDMNSGMAIACGLKTPTVRAAKLFLAKNITDEQDKILEAYSSQKILKAYRRKCLMNLPHRREVSKDILFALEEQMMSPTPF